MSRHRDEIEDVAAWWVARMDASGWNDRSEAELQAWLDQDARHAGALLAAQAAWHSVDGLQTALPVLRAPLVTGGAMSFKRRSAIIGACAAVAAVAMPFVYRRHVDRYDTGLGEIRRVPLSDGSIAAINTSSSISVSMQEAQRDITLTRGESWFQVASDHRRPFIVEAGRIRVRAVGTAFSVRRRESGVEIAVTEGVVDTWSLGAEGAGLRLVAGERARIREDAGSVRLPADSEAVDRTLAWRDGKIDFNHTLISDAVNEFNRYNRRQLVLSDAYVGREPIDGIFATDDPEGFASAVEAMFRVPVDTNDPMAIRIGRMVKN